MFTYDEKLDELKRELDRREMLYPAHMRANLLSGHGENLRPATLTRSESSLSSVFN
jgi:hypothetical protein